METASFSPEYITTILENARVRVNLVAPLTDMRHVYLLEALATAASQVAQDLRVQHEADMQVIEELEVMERYGFDAHAACGQ